MPRKAGLLAAARVLRHDRGNGIKGREINRGVDREAFMKRVLSGVFASVLAIAATAAFAQGKPPLKLGGILDMSGLYADITGPGSETAAKMAAEDSAVRYWAARSRSSRPTISTRPIFPPTSPAICSTTRASR